METDSGIRRMWMAGFELKQQYGEENVADMTFGNPVAQPPELLRQTLQEIVSDPPEDLHRYTHSAGAPEVRERVADHLDARGILPGVDASHVMMTSGASAATNIALRTILEPGDEVILIAPHFPDYPAHVLNHGGTPIVVPTTADFLPDLGAIARSIGPKTRALIINHPNNPTGRQYSEDDLKALATLLRDGSAANKRTIYLISDEPYREIRFTTEPFVSPARVYEHGLMAYSFSKSHSVPGERIGYLAVNPRCPEADVLVDAMSFSNRILGFTNAPVLWQHVISRCLDAVIDLEQLRGYRARLMKALIAKGYEVTETEGTFYLYPKTPDTDDETFVQRARNELLLLVPGETFGCSGYFRMAFCVDDRTVDLAVERLPWATCRV